MSVGRSSPRIGSGGAKASDKSIVRPQNQRRFCARGLSGQNLTLGTHHDSRRNDLDVVESGHAAD